MKKFWKVLLAVAIGGALSGAAEGITSDKFDVKHVSKTAAVGAVLTVAAYLKNSSTDENPGDDDDTPSHSHKKD